MKVLLTKPVKKWLDKEKYVDEEDMVSAANEVVERTYEASLGGHLFKKRISNNAGKGKSGGSRLIVGYEDGQNLFYLHVFNKNDVGNIDARELKALKARIKILLSLDEDAINKAIAAKILFDIGVKKQ